MNCKAITTKYLSWTETKPARIKASAEGVPAKVWSRDSLEEEHAKTPGTDHLNLQEFAARKFAAVNNWKGALAGGGLSADVWVHCFVPPVVPAPVSVNDTLAAACRDLLSAYAPNADAQAPEGLHSAVKAARKALEQAKPFLRGQELIVAQARTFVAESWATQPAKSDGTRVCSGYHFELLRNALVLLDEKATEEQRQLHLLAQVAAAPSTPSRKGIPACLDTL